MPRAVFLTMLLSGTWDIRVSDALKAFFLRIRAKGAYYWKLSNEEATTLISILCTSYNVPAIPTFTTTNLGALKARRACGLCEFVRGNSKISTYPRPHFKTVAHEVYHHIDFYYRYELRKPRYNSSDAKQHAWNFAEKLWKAVQAAIAVPDVVPVHLCSVIDGVEHHAELFGSELDLSLKVSRFPSDAVVLPSARGVSLQQVWRQRLALADASLVYKIYALRGGAHALAWAVSR